MAREFSEDFEQFMLQQVAICPSLLGDLVRGYFARPIVTKQRAEMPIFPGKDWGTYDVRDSATGVFECSRRLMANSDVVHWSVALRVGR